MAFYKIKIRINGLTQSKKKQGGLKVLIASSRLTKQKATERLFQTIREKKSQQTGLLPCQHNPLNNPKFWFGLETSYFSFYSSNQRLPVT